MITYFTKHASIARKIQIAFGLLIAFVAFGAGFIAWEVTTLSGHVSEYRQMSRQTIAIGAATAQFQEMRVQAVKLDSDPNPSTLDTFRKMNIHFDEEMKLANDNATSEDVKAKLKDFVAKRDSYLVAFEQSATDPTALQRRNQIAASVDQTAAVLLADARKSQLALGELMMGKLKDSANAAFALIAIIVLVGGAFGLMLANIIATPLTQTTALMENVAKGHIDDKLDDLDRRDCVGRLRRALAVFISNAQEMRALEAQAKATELEVEATKRSTMNELARSFEASVSHVVETVASAATELEATSRTLSRTAQDTSAHSSAVARTADMSASNVQAVASASEQMSTSIYGIAQQVKKAAMIARDAENKAAQTNVTVLALSEAASKIGAVVSLISEIASQTNLLALNATIEAARAGEAGKGFAVVASEVKSLAEQTAKATDEISMQIGGVQTATQEAVGAIDGISKTISQINVISTAISEAVEEQMTAVREVARNTSDVAAATSQVSQAIGLVQQGSTETGAAAEQSLGAALELGQQAVRLKSEVDGFLVRVRAA